MTINNFQQASHPAHASFGPVLNVGYLPGVVMAGPPLKVPRSARAGALVAGIALALTVLAVPTGALALTVAQINPALAARNAQPVQPVQRVQPVQPVQPEVTTQTTDTQATDTQATDTQATDTQATDTDLADPPS
jgi:hypothetical protein